MIKKCVATFERESMRFLVRSSAFSGAAHFLFNKLHIQGVFTWKITYTKEIIRTNSN